MSIKIERHVAWKIAYRLVKHQRHMTPPQQSDGESQLEDDVRIWRWPGAWGNSGEIANYHVRLPDLLQDRRRNVRGSGQIARRLIDSHNEIWASLLDSRRRFFHSHKYE